MPDEEPATPESIIPQWEKIEKIATEIETIFFESSAKELLSPFDMSIVVNRLVLLFDEYKLVHFAKTYGQQTMSESKTIGINGRDSIYK